MTPVIVTVPRFEVINEFANVITSPVTKPFVLGTVTAGARVYAAVVVATGVTFTIAGKPEPLEDTRVNPVDSGTPSVVAEKFMFTRVFVLAFVKFAFEVMLTGACAPASVNVLVAPSAIVVSGTVPYAELLTTNAKFVVSVTVATVVEFELTVMGSPTMNLCPGTWTFERV